MILGPQTLSFLISCVHLEFNNLPYFEYHLLCAEHCWYTVEINITAKVRQIVHIIISAARGRCRQEYQKTEAILGYMRPISRKRKKENSREHSDLVLMECFSPTNGPQILETIRWRYFYKYSGYYKRKQGAMEYIEIWSPAEHAGPCLQSQHSGRPGGQPWSQSKFGASWHNRKPCLKETWSIIAGEEQLPWGNYDYTEGKLLVDRDNLSRREGKWLPTGNRAYTRPWSRRYVKGTERKPDNVIHEDQSCKSTGEEVVIPVQLGLWLRLGDF